MAKTTDFTFDIMEGYDHIIEEGASSSINLRKVRWGNAKDYKLDLRRWTYTDEGERASKGVTLTDEGANELTKVLVNDGYGDTKEILRSLSNRDDFEISLETYHEDDSETADDLDDEGYYDPNELLA